MGEGILRTILSPDMAEQVHVSSAGTGAMADVPASSLAVEVSAAHGIDIRDHRSTPLTAPLLREADLILCMEPVHVARAKDLAPDSSDRIHLITHSGDGPSHGGDAGISDPMGGVPRAYEEAFNRIRSHLLRWLPRIREAVERSEGVR